MSLSDKCMQLAGNKALLSFCSYTLLVLNSTRRLLSCDSHSPRSGTMSWRTDDESSSYGSKIVPHSQQYPRQSNLASTDNTNRTCASECVRSSTVLPRSPIPYGIVYSTCEQRFEPCPGSRFSERASFLLLRLKLQKQTTPLLTSGTLAVRAVAALSKKGRSKLKRTYF